jgi:CheY-like chemotaxis protein
MIYRPPVERLKNQRQDLIRSFEVKKDTPSEDLERFILETFSIGQNFKKYATPTNNILVEPFVLDVGEDTLPGEIERFIRESVDAKHRLILADHDGGPLMRELILVVEDHIPTQRLERLILQAEGHLVKMTNKGEDALRILKESSPALVLLDVGLPGEDGFATCKRIRAFSQVPIIMVTGRDSADDQAKARECGADDFLVKAFFSRELAAHVQTLLDRSKTRRQSVDASYQGDDIDASKELYEGTVPVVAQVTGSMRRLVEFAGELRDHMDLRVLRFEPHQTWVNVTLCLRRPLPLKTILLEMSSVEQLDSRMTVEDQETILVHLLP